MRAFDCSRRRALRRTQAAHAPDREADGRERSLDRGHGTHAGGDSGDCGQRLRPSAGPGRRGLGRLTGTRVDLLTARRLLLWTILYGAAVAVTLGLLLVCFS